MTNQDTQIPQESRATYVRFLSLLKVGTVVTAVAIATVLILIS